MYQRVRKNVIKKAIKEKGIWSGFIVGNKVNPSHYFAGWCLASKMEFTSIEQFDKTEINFMVYLPGELGNRMACYIEL